MYKKSVAWQESIGNMLQNVFGPCYAALDQDISDNDFNHNLLLHLYSYLAYVGAVCHPGFLLSWSNMTTNN